MTIKEAKKFVRKHKRYVKKECRQCRRAHNGAYGVLCEHCLHKWQRDIDEVLKEFKE